MDERTIIHITAKPPSIPTIDCPFRVAAYCRVSSPAEEQELSLETQGTYYTDKINGNPLWVNVGVFADTATGWNTNGASRPDLNRVLLGTSISLAMDIVSMKQNKRL